MTLLIVYHYLFMKADNLSIWELWDDKYRVKEIEIEKKKLKVLPEHKKDLKEFSLVCVVKFILTEGEKFIIFAFSSFVTRIFIV